ncbi:MAG: DUF1501 domain-containing protein [Planctomycetales bacterium]
MNPHCPRNEHISRRALMKGALATAAGATVMNWGGLTSTPAFAAEVAKKQKHCIMLWMNGGASQFETFDMKVGRPTGGIFREIDTDLPGYKVCELMPEIAKRIHKLAVIRSMRTSQIDHPGGIYLMHAGYAEAANVRFPEIGAIVAKYAGDPNSDLPNFVKISAPSYTGAGFLGPKYQPFGLDQNGRLPTFSVSGMNPADEQRRHELRSFIEESYARDHQAEPTRMHQQAYEQARRLQNVRSVFDVESEWQKYKEKYGDSAIGRKCLTARCLVEAGIAFVEAGHDNYDTHADNFTGHKARVPVMEKAWAALLDDLEERGLLQDTLVIWTGEIGRTPSINNRSGRDHYVRSWSTALAGAGVKGGLVYGESDRDGHDVKDNPVTEGDFFATIYKALGIDPTIENYAGIRPIPLAPFGSKVVEDLLA